MTLTCRPDGTFHILQLTDFHLDTDAALAEQTWIAADDFVKRTKPDFLAFTGDIWCGDEAPVQGRILFDDTRERAAAYGIPWAFCWGNHDNMDRFECDQRTLKTSPGWALTHTDGRGNGRCEIHENGQPRWDLFFINSGHYWGEFPAIDWLARESMALQATRGAVIPAVVFFHIPLGAYERVRQESNYDGIALEEALCWGDEEDTLADTIADLGNVRACYCGHSHRNDFAFTHRAVRFAYGRSTGFGGYGELEKGAKRIILHADGRCEDETLLPR